ncbi:MAG: hypothetical protein ACI9IL_000966 [Rickettsiales bacterium]|jgi:hypothetical protein
MSELDQIRKEARIEAFTLGLLNFYRNNRVKIFSILFILILAATSYVGKYLYNKNINQKYSVILQGLFLDKIVDNDKLKTLVDQNNSSGIKFIASMQYAKILAKEGKFDKAIDLYLAINNSKEYDDFFKEYAGLLAIRYLVEFRDDKKYDIIGNIRRIKEGSSNLKSHIIEQEAIYLWKIKEYKESEDLFKALFDSVGASEGIRKRARMMLEIEFNK